MAIHSLCVMTTEASMRSHVSLLILRLEWPRPRQINHLRNVECFGCLNIYLLLALRLQVIDNNLDQKQWSGEHNK